MVTKATYNSAMLKLNSMQIQLKYLKANNDWEPYRYNVFVDEIKQSIQMLKEMNKNFSKNSIDKNEKAVGNRADDLLQQYVSVWESDFD